MQQESDTSGHPETSDFGRADDNSSRIRARRIALDMQGRELAAKMSVSPARVSVLERDERRGAVTLKMMQKAALALGCEFVYALVPNKAHQSGRQQPRQASKPRIHLASSQLSGDSEQQRRLLQQAYARRLAEMEQA